MHSNEYAGRTYVDILGFTRFESKFDLYCFLPMARLSLWVLLTGLTRLIEGHEMIFLGFWFL